MGRPGYLTLPIFSVLAAIGYVYYTTVFVAVAGWLGLATAAGVANAAAFTALAAACLATYAVAVCRDPGRVPPAFLPDVEDAETPVHEVKRKVRAPAPGWLLPAVEFWDLWSGMLFSVLAKCSLIRMKFVLDVVPVYRINAVSRQFG